VARQSCLTNWVCPIWLGLPTSIWSAPSAPCRTPMTRLTSSGRCWNRCSTRQASGDPYTDRTYEGWWTRCCTSVSRSRARAPHSKVPRLGPRQWCVFPSPAGRADLPRSATVPGRTPGREGLDHPSAGDLPAESMSARSSGDNGWTSSLSTSANCSKAKPSSFASMNSAINAYVLARRAVV
jgi:hypothetical protein